MNSEMQKQWRTRIKQRVEHTISDLDRDAVDAAEAITALVEYECVRAWDYGVDKTLLHAKRARDGVRLILNQKEHPNPYKPEQKPLTSEEFTDWLADVFNLSGTERDHLGQIITNRDEQMRNLS